ncbi:hypothetical protein MU1_40080 [Paenibacillus glycanilyticus]|uniref:Uncharacterized protein n=1 Tax=Paenibacillus glycanilyticus TaxID=126569 RepID=A0ABQ6GJX1_9BACL|nr:hypothetical protein MU1_40080 [Paenibacillus glycanilyticus]
MGDDSFAEAGEITETLNKAVRLNTVMNFLVAIFMNTKNLQNNIILLVTRPANYRVYQIIRGKVIVHNYQITSYRVYFFRYDHM